MDKTQIIIVAVAFAILAVRLYLKFIKREKNKGGSERKPISDSSFSSSSRDEDYEPYSKK